LRRIHRVRPRAGFRLTQKEVTIAASQTIKKYDMLKKSSGAQTFEQAIADPGSDGPSAASGGNLGIFGVAASSITTGSGGSEATTGRTTIPVWVFDDNLEYLMRTYDGTAESSDPDNANFPLGTQFQFLRYRVNANELFYALITTTTSGELVFVEAPVEVAITTNYGPVWVRANTLEAIRQG
jgi:hypothetical protein